MTASVNLFGSCFRIIYTRLPAGGNYYPIYMFPTNAFCLRVSVIFPTCSLYPQQKCAYSAYHPQAWIYNYIQVHTSRYLPSEVPWISEDRLFMCATNVFL